MTKSHLGQSEQFRINNLGKRLLNLAGEMRLVAHHLRDEELGAPDLRDGLALDADKCEALAATIQRESESEPLPLEVVQAFVDQHSFWYQGKQFVPPTDHHSRLSIAKVMTPHQTRILCARYMNGGMTIKRIAAKFGTTPQTMGRQLSKAELNLHKALYRLHFYPETNQGDADSVLTDCHKQLSQQEDVDPAQWINRSVEYLELSVRANSCLRNANIETVGELIGRSEADLMKAKHFGKKALAEIIDELNRLGLRLREADTEANGILEMPVGKTL
jgi:predicted transcriptional regulator